MESEKWKETTSRFVAFFDIMGFKEMVERNTHSDVLAKLKLLKSSLSALEKANSDLSFSKDFSTSETKAITFSDSIVFFSKSNSERDFNKIIIDSCWLISEALKIGIGIKGALSYGIVTVDFENSLFFGRPIIDAYLLHEQLYLYSAVLDNHIEKKMQSFNLHNDVKNSIVSYKTNMKSGKVFHRLICPPDKLDVVLLKGFATKLYETVSGSPRIYVDNTLDFLNIVLPDS